MLLADIKTTPNYVVLPIKESDNRKMVCNPIPEVGSPTSNGNYVYMEVGCRRDGLLLHPFPHLALAVDLVAAKPNASKSATDKIHSYHTGK
jgi:hypothetical protein